MQCYKCQLKIKEKITFRSVCAQCYSDLHVCINCQSYAPGKPNDCKISEIDKVVDKEKNNFCEYFVYQDQRPPLKNTSKIQVAKKLFKDGDKNDHKTKSFDDLFKD